LTRNGFVISSGLKCTARFENADFTVRRFDGVFSYQLAVVVDDAFQGITDIVRGDDLIDSRPPYKHIQVVRYGLDPKLSRQTWAPPLDLNRVPELASMYLAAQEKRA